MYVTHAVKMKLFCAHGQNFVIDILVKYTFSHLNKVVYKILKLDNLKQSYACLTFGIQKYEMEKSVFKVWVLSLDQLPTGPEMIKITPF